MQKPGHIAKARGPRGWPFHCLDGVAEMTRAVTGCRGSIPGLRVLGLLGVWATGCGLLMAKDPRAGAAHAAGEVGTQGVDDVSTSIDRRNLLADTYQESALGQFMKPWDIRREAFFKDMGLELGLSYNAYGQSYFGGGRTVGGLAGELTLDGRWFILGNRIGAPMHLGFRIRDRHRIGGRPPSAIGEEIGAFWGTIRGFSNAGTEVPDFYLEQEFFDRRLDFRFGQMNSKNLFDGHALRSSKQAFGNRLFSESPAVAFPRFGTGAYLRWQDNDGWEASLGASNIQGTSEMGGSDFKLTRAQLFEALQFAYNFDGWRGEEARLQVTGWRADALPDVQRPAGMGLALVAEQVLCDGRDRVFLRFATENGGSTPADRTFAVGYGTQLREFDQGGVALGVGRRNGTDEWQWVMEGFYRWQIGKEFHLSPTLQVLYGDGFVDGNGPHFIAGLHGGISF